MVSIFQIIQNEVRKVDKCIVIDPPDLVLSLQGRILKALRHLLPLLFQPGLLSRTGNEPELLYIVQRVADLMTDAQRYEDIRIQVRIHMRMQVGPELMLPPDVGLHEGLAKIQMIVLCLAHERLGNRRHVGLSLNFTVRINVRHLRIIQTEDIDLPVVPVYIAGNLAANDFEPALVKADRQITERGKVRDQIPGLMIGRPENVGELSVLAVELHNNIFFLIQIELTEFLHSDSFSSSFTLRSHSS